MAYDPSRMTVRDVHFMREAAKAAGDQWRVTMCDEALAYIAHKLIFSEPDPTEQEELSWNRCAEVVARSPFAVALVVDSDRARVTSVHADYDGAVAEFRRICPKPDYPTGGPYLVRPVFSDVHVGELIQYA